MTDYVYLCNCGLIVQHELKTMIVCPHCGDLTIISPELVEKYQKKR